MKRLIQIFQALLGVTALILTALIAAGRLACRTVKSWWRRHSKRLRYSLVTLAALGAVGIAALTAYGVYDDKYGRDYYDHSISQGIRLHSFADNKWRVYNCRIGAYTTPKINWVKWDGDREDSLAVYALPNRRGYINVNTGRIVIDAEANDYQKAWLFSEGLAAVMKGGKIGFINAKNEVVLPFQYDYSDECRMYDFGYLFHNGYCAMTNAEGDLGLIDRSGNWVVEPVYDEVWALHESGFRIVVDDGKYGVLDASGAIVYPAEYRFIDIVSDGFVLDKAGRRWQVDFNGKTVLPFMFDEMSYLSYPIEYNDSGDLIWRLSDYAMYEISNRCGIMNRLTGKPLTPAIYSGIEMLSKDLFKVQEYYSYDWYLIDANGNIVENL